MVLIYLSIFCALCSTALLDTSQGVAELRWLTVICRCRKLTMPAGAMSRPLPPAVASARPLFWTFASVATLGLLLLRVLTRQPAVIDSGTMPRDAQLELWNTFRQRQQQLPTSHILPPGQHAAPAAPVDSVFLAENSGERARLHWSAYVAERARCLAGDDASTTVEQLGATEQSGGSASYFVTDAQVSSGPLLQPPLSPHSFNPTPRVRTDAQRERLSDSEQPSEVTVVRCTLHVSSASLTQPSFRTLF